MEIVNKIATGTKVALSESFNNAIHHAAPGATTAAKTLANYVKQSREQRLHKLEDQYGDTVSETEFNYALGLVKRQWSYWPHLLALRMVKYVAPGLSNEDDNKEMITNFTKFASQKKANHHANIAVSYLIPKLAKLAKPSGGFIWNLFPSSQKFIPSPLAKAYIDSTMAWINALDTNDETDLTVIKSLLSTVNSYSMPENVQEQLASALRNKRSTAQAAVEKQGG